MRWEREREWSPWNTVLLTREEAQAHSRIERVEEVCVCVCVCVLWLGRNSKSARD